MTGIADQVVIVTGGASGIGRAIVERFHAEGARVVILDKAKDALDALVASLGERALAVHGDVTHLADNRRAVEAAVSAFGRLDTFIGNAGIFDYSTPLVDLHDDAIDAAFDEIFAVNVKAYLFGAKAAVGALVRSRGSLVFTLSVATTRTSCGGPLYTASKHAGVGLVQQLAYELAPFVRVNAVAPGAVRTDLRGARALGQDSRALADVLPPDEVVAKVEPMGRFADAREHVGPYLLLASRKDGATLTGVVLPADSGAGIRGILQPSGGSDLGERFGAR